MRRWLVGVMAVALLVAGAPVARGCSCAIEDDRTSLSRAHGAFVGAMREVAKAPEGPEGETAYEFAVERSVKGDLGSTVTVWSGSDSCALSPTAGRRVGLLLYRNGERWHAGSCSYADPDSLLRAAEPMPAPDGVGPTAFLAAGRFGDVRVLALDREGRTLAYGAGDGADSEVAGIDLCPGGSTVVTVSGFGGPPRLRRYSMPGLALVSERPLDGGSGPVACRSASGDDVMVAVAKDRSTTVVRVRGNDAPVPVWSGDGTQTHFDGAGRLAWVLSWDGPGATRVDLGTGRATTVALPGPPMGSGVSDGGRLAVLTAERLLVIEAGGARRAERAMASTYGTILWSGESTVVVAGERTVNAFDSRLAPKGEWVGDVRSASAFRDGRLYTAASGHLLSADPVKGGQAEVRALPSPALHFLLAVPAAAAPPPAAVTTTTTTEPPTTTTAEPPTTTTAARDPGPDEQALSSEPAGSSRDGVGGMGWLAGLAWLAAAAAAAGLVVRRRRRAAGMAEVDGNRTRL